MKHQNLTLIAIGCALGFVPLLAAARSQEPKSDPSKSARATEAKSSPPKFTGITLWPASDIKWVPMPGLEGAQQAPLWGDPTKGPHGILYKWPGGTKVPVHTHTSGDRGVIVSGTLTLAVEGAPPKRLPPGSYFTMAGGTKHATATEDGAPCVFFIEREGAFDVNMVEEPKAR